MRFSLFGVKVFVSFLAVALLCLTLFMSYTGTEVLMLCLLSAVIHETGHLIFICKFCGKPDSIAINPGEVRINANLSDISYKLDLLITSAGVLFNFLSSYLLSLINLFLTSSILYKFVICNLCIGIFNLLPIKTFDGAQFLANILMRRFSMRTTDTIINILTVILIIPIFTAGFYILLVSRYNYNLLLITIYFISIIITKEMR